MAELSEAIKIKATGRCALVGNPFDLVGQAEAKMKQLIEVDGAILSIPIRNLYASATLKLADEFIIIAPRSKFKNLIDCIDELKIRGVGDWEHIADMAIVVFGEIMAKLGLEVQPLKVKIILKTCIPRQRGLSGSSGMITAIIFALLKAHNAENELTVKELAQYVLKVENQLGVTAGLQDRILQAAYVFDPKIDAVFMDFGVESRREGCDFSPLKLSDRKRMFSSALILSSQPSHSGKVHKPIVAKLRRRGKRIIRAFSELGEIGYHARNAFMTGDWFELGGMMTATAEKRIEIYGEEVLGPLNMAIVEACRAAGVYWNFTGSGGAVVAMLPEGDESFDRLKIEVEKRGNFEIYRLT
ncbi:MAG: glucuronokinase 1-like [Candidatus Berkelbacteria bacterium Athens1014_28]|uniref:Glucuronokinase 1-like n=1 Tax=Candidatus Berkelbacteria bacterium Athens1014_28 TaxID=2017145 RepID=A0A554LL24_9BACT|nr:MAG: glucuronokinase 1-like [Candidatus Berkelbacteria bacterium Athens1014_28]